MKRKKQTTANPTRIPRNTGSASLPRYPACTRRSCSLPISFRFLGTFSPIRLRNATACSVPGSEAVSGYAPPTTSRSRAFMPVERAVRAYVSPMTTTDPSTKASSGSIIDTLHLDLDDLFDPDEPDCLHHDARNDHHLPHALLEQQVHMRGIEERERDGEKGRQRHEHVAGKSAVRAVHAHLPPDLEPFAHDAGEVVQNFRQVTA